MGKVGDLIDLFRKIDRLLSLEEKHGKAIEGLQKELSDLKARMAALEAREQMLVVEAKSAARTASGLTTQASLSDLSRRLGRMEAEAEMVRTGRQPPALDRPATPDRPSIPKPRTRRRKAE